MNRKQKILIVDDKPANLFSLEMILKETGAEIIKATNGNEALVASLNHDFAIALLDVEMPNMDGYELAELLRSEEKTKELPILFVSAVYSSDYHVFKGYEAGAVDFMVKPYNAEVLLSKVRVFLKLDLQKNLLNEANAGLATTNDTLELRVQEKTADLNRMLTELRTEIERRQQAEKEILKAKKEWQEIFEAIGHMTMILDKDHTVIAANRATVEKTGLPLEKIIGRKCHTIFHNTQQPLAGCPLSTMLQKASSQVITSEIEALGKTFIVSCTPVFDEKGGLEKIIHIATDITAIKHMKKELIQAHKMEAIGSLAGGIAHDFNNILSAVLGFTELSLRRVEKGSALEEDLHQIYTAGIRARDLVKQILNFARKTDENPKPVRIDLVAKEVVKFLRSSIASSIEITENIASRSHVLANPVKIHQLFMNLCTNAAFAMNDSGVLKVSLEDVLLTEADLPSDKPMLPGPYQRLEVSDNGCGIPPDIIDIIFQPFFTTKGLHEGTGMGLAMVHTIVKECVGDISVASEVGKGTVFTILLPITTMEEKQETFNSGEILPQGNERILLVDDEIPICKLASRILEGYGYKVTTETDSEKALALFAAQPDAFDLVVTDMTMPKISGSELTEKLLQMRPGLPIIIATGYSRKMSDAEALELGARLFLAKPFEKTCLVRAVRKVLDENGLLKNTEE
ncbi:MAG: response regulator [Proteobacteria bacterium]|nr:response regulator [Pseudomonadota bacterium]